MARPPRLPDAAILELIHELRGQNAALTGTQLRDELRRRHGTPCGVARVYRLLQTAMSPTATPSPSVHATGPDSPDLRAELATALERARLAEYREEHHQARWASEIHELREQVRTLRDAAHRLTVLERDVLDRSRELAAAYRRIADLETQLRALTGQ
jgi:hypothetical protein